MIQAIWLNYKWTIETIDIATYITLTLLLLVVLIVLLPLFKGDF